MFKLVGCNGNLIGDGFMYLPVIRDSESGMVAVFDTNFLGQGLNFYPPSRVDGLWTPFDSPMEVPQHLADWKTGFYMMRKDGKWLIVTCDS